MLPEVLSRRPQFLSHLQFAKEILLKMFSCNGTLYQFRIQVFQNRTQIIVCDLFNLIQDLFVPLLRNHSFLGISLSAFSIKQLLKNVFQVQLRSPSETFCKKGRAMAFPSLIWANI